MVTSAPGTARWGLRCHDRHMCKCSKGLDGFYKRTRVCIRVIDGLWRVLLGVRDPSILSLTLPS